MKTQLCMARWIPLGALALVLTAPLAFAQGMGQQQGQMMQNTGHQVKSQVKPGASEWNARFEKMQKIMQQVQREKNPATRRALMRQHLHLMMQNMSGMMHGMGRMGSRGMHGGGMGRMGAGGAGGQMGPQAMQVQVQRMQGQMRAMAQMMQQMLEQLSAMQGAGGH